MAWVTKEEISNAKRYDLLTFLQHTNPYDLVKKSANEYGLKTHDSLKISNGLWNWHSHGIGGRTALDYNIHVDFLNDATGENILGMDSKDLGDE